MFGNDIVFGFGFWYVILLCFSLVLEFDLFLLFVCDSDVCVMYISIFKKSKELGFWDENEWFLFDIISFWNVFISFEFRFWEFDLWLDMYSEVGDLRLDEFRDDVSVRFYSNYYSEDLLLWGYFGGDIFRKCNFFEYVLVLSFSRGRDFNGDFLWLRGGFN